MDTQNRLFDNKYIRFTECYSGMNSPLWAACVSSTRDIYTPLKFLCSAKGNLGQSYLWPVAGRKLRFFVFKAPAKITQE